LIEKLIPSVGDNPTRGISASSDWVRQFSRAIGEDFQLI